MMFLSSHTVPTKHVFPVVRNSEDPSPVYPVIEFLIEHCQIHHDPQFRTPSESQILSDLLVWATTSGNDEDQCPVYSVYCFNQNMIVYVLDI